MEKTTVALLSRPFPKSDIKQRKGPEGKTLDYVEVHTVIARLNEVLVGDWSFEVLDHRQRGGGLG